VEFFFFRRYFFKRAQINNIVYNKTYVFLHDAKKAEYMQKQIAFDRLYIESSYITTNNYAVAGFEDANLYGSSPILIYKYANNVYRINVLLFIFK